MAKQSMIEREKKRLYLVTKYGVRRRNLKQKIKAANNFETKY